MTAPASPAGIRKVEVSLLSSIHDIPAAAWDQLAGPDDFYLSHGWLSWVERDSSARAWYLVAHIGDRLAGALPVYRLLTEFGSYYRMDRFRHLLGLDGAYLIAGARRGYRGGLLTARHLIAGDADDVARGLLSEALALSAGAGLDGVILPFLPTDQLERLGQVAPVLAAFDSAEAILPAAAGGLTAYLADLPGKRRYTARKERARYAAAGWRTTVESLDGTLPEAARLVSLVEQRHGHVSPDFLLRRIFRWQLSALGPASVVITCRDGDDIAACTVNYAWRDTLYNHAVGLDDDRLRDGFEYFNLLIYEAVDYCARARLDRVQLSIATRAKLQRGARARPLWTAAVLPRSAHRAAGLRITDPAAADRWRAPYESFTHAFLADDWRMPVTAELSG